MAFFYRGTPENRELKRIVPCTLYPIASRGARALCTYPQVLHLRCAQLKIKSEE